MKGLVINGFTVVEALGSGQHGVLYLARDASTGREAVIRIARDAEDTLSVRVFVEEARGLLPLAGDVETTTTSDGRKVLIAATRPGPSGAPSPGTGFTEYPVTQRLPRIDAPPSRTRVVIPLLAAALVVAGVAAALSLRPPPTAPVAVAPPPPPPPAPVAPLDAGVPPEPAVVSPEPAPSPVKLPAPRQSPGRPCVASLAWRGGVEADLQELTELAALLDERVHGFTPVETAQEAMLVELKALPLDGDCRPLEARLTALKTTWLRRFEPHRCTPDDHWRRTMSSELLDLEGKAPAASLQALRGAVARAGSWADCLRVARQLDLLRAR